MTRVYKTEYRRQDGNTENIGNLKRVLLKTSTMHVRKLSRVKEKTGHLKALKGTVWGIHREPGRVAVYTRLN